MRLDPNQLTKVRRAVDLALRLAHNYTGTADQHRQEWLREIREAREIVGAVDDAIPCEDTTIDLSLDEPDRVKTCPDCNGHGGTYHGDEISPSTQCDTCKGGGYIEIDDTPPEPTAKQDGSGCSDCGAALEPDNVTGYCEDCYTCSMCCGSLDPDSDDACDCEGGIN